MTEKPKRRWLRFNLRTLLVVLTVFCVWLGWYLGRVESQREAVQWVLENGGTVRYFVGDSPTPKWLVEKLGVDYFYTVRSVKLSKTRVSDLTPLAGLANLESLKLYETQVSDVTPLAGLTNLEYLDIRQTQVSDEDIEKLKLALPNCNISHAGKLVSRN